MFHPTGRRLSFSVMTLNLRFGLADDGLNSWYYRQKAYAPLLSAYPNDFFAFQEANQFQVDFLAAQLPDYRHIGVSHPTPGNWQHNVIFHHRRWRCLSADHFYLSTTPERPSQFSGSRWPRQCTLGIFETSRFRLVVVNTHFDFTEEVQVRSARLIRRRLRRHAVREPIILMGDFNTTPHSACYAEFTVDKGDDGPVFKNVFNPPFEGTHHGFTGVNRHPPIDWILYRGDLQVQRAVVDTRAFCGIFPSDHFPVFARFSAGQ